MSTRNRVLSSVVRGRNTHTTRKVVCESIEANRFLYASVSVGDGTALDPSVRFADDPDTGLYRGAAGGVCITDDGVEVACFVNNAGTAEVRVGESTNASSVFLGDATSTQAQEVRLHNDGTAEKAISFRDAGVETWRIAEDTGGNLVIGNTSATGNFLVDDGPVRRPTRVSLMIDADYNATAQEVLANYFAPGALMSANRNWNSPTAAAIVAALPGAPTVGTYWDVIVNNSRTGEVWTRNIVAGVGVTFIGTPGILAGETASLRFVVTNATGGSEAVTLLRVIPAAESLQSAYNVSGAADPKILLDPAVGSFSIQQDAGALVTEPFYVNNSTGTVNDRLCQITSDNAKMNRLGANWSVQGSGADPGGVGIGNNIIIERDRIEMVVLGANTRIETSQTLVLGYSAQSTHVAGVDAPGNVVIGDSANASSLVVGGKNTIIGASSTISNNGEYSTCVGYRARSRAAYITSIGYNANSSGNSLGQYSTAIGRDASCEYDNTTAVGYDALAGNQTSSTAGNAVAVGYQASANADPLVPVGNDNNSVAVGFQATASENASAAIGSNASSTAAFGVALGYSTNASDNGTVAAGAYAEASGLNALAIGGAESLANRTQATNTASVAIGRKAVSSGDSSIAIGVESVSSGANTNALGYQAQAIGDSSLAVGNTAVVDAGSTQSVAIGYGASVTGGIINVLAVGHSASVTASAAFAIGARATATEQYGVAIGSVAPGDPTPTTASQRFSLAVGGAAVASGGTAAGGSIAVGYQATTAGYDHAVALGHGAAAQVDDGVAIGFNARSVSQTIVATPYPTLGFPVSMGATAGTYQAVAGTPAITNPSNPQRMLLISLSDGTTTNTYAAPLYALP